MQATYDEIKRVIKEASQSDQLKEYIAYTEDQVSTRVLVGKKGVPKLSD